MAGLPGMMPPGMPGMGGPMPAGSDPAMAALEGLSGVPAPQREEKAMADASAQIQIALTGVYSRSAKAAKHLSTAYKEIQLAREALSQLPQQGVGAPPDLLGSPLPMGQGMPPMG